MSLSYFTQSDPVFFSVKRGQRQSSSLGQSDMNNLKAILKETAKSCDIDAIIKVTETNLMKVYESANTQIASVSGKGCENFIPIQKLNCTSARVHSALLCMIIM